MSNALPHPMESVPPALHICSEITAENVIVQLRLHSPHKIKPTFFLTQGEYTVPENCLRHYVSVVFSAALLSSCGPGGCTPNGGGGNNNNGGNGGGGGNNGGPPVTSACLPDPDQGGDGLLIDCTVTGSPDTLFIDPLDSGNTACTPFNANPFAGPPNDVRDARLLTVFNQALNVPVRIIYGENGDEDGARVRIGFRVDPSTHTASVGKTPTDCSLPGSFFPLTTEFSGRHVAMIDKQQTPACVYQSAYTPATYTQTVGGSGPDIGAASRSSIENAIARQLDLEAARVYNRLVQPNAILEGAFARRAGRCANDYERFSE